MSYIRAFRQQYNLTQHDMGLLVGRSRGSIASYEAGLAPVDPAVSSLVRMLEGQPLQAIRERIRTNREKSDQDTESALSDLLLKSETVSSFPASSTAPDGVWHVQRHVPSRQFSLADIARLAVVPATEGGFLTPEHTRQALGPLALNSRLSRLGARFLTADGTNQDYRIPKLLGDPSGFWIAEGGEATQASISMASYNASFQTVAVGLSFTRTLLRMMGPAGLRAFAASMQRGLAASIDKACLLGSGVNGEPLGLLAHDGITQLDCDGHDQADIFRQAIETLENNGVDCESLSVVATPATKRRQSGPITDFGEGGWLYTAPSIAGGAGGQTFRGYRAMATPHYIDGRLLIGSFSEITVQMASEVDVRVRDLPGGGHEAFGFLDCSVSIPRADKAFVEVLNVP